MRILITGGAGFIGSNFIHHLLHAGGLGDSTACCPDAGRPPSTTKPSDLQILNVDKLTYAGSLRNLDGVRDLPAYRFAKTDICDAAAVAQLVQEFAPETILHFAAESHVDRSIESGLDFARTNVVGTQALLEAARREGVPRFVHVGTDEVYGSTPDASFLESDSLAPSNPYSASKAGSDLLVLAHHRTYGMNTTVVRCTNNYGPRQHPEKLIPKTITQAMKNQPVPVYAQGTNVRDWLYVRDNCAAIETVLRAGAAGEIYNVAGRNERPNLEVVKTVLRMMGKPDSLIQFVPDRPGHDFRYSLNDDKLRALGWAPRVRLEEGLRHTLAWFASTRTEVEPAA